MDRKNNWRKGVQSFGQLPIASLLMFTLGVVLSRDFSQRYVASIVVAFLVATLLWTVAKSLSRRVKLEGREIDSEGLALADITAGAMNGSRIPGARYADSPQVAAVK
jgi:hypothetical protein